jgi:hypothetical protein
MGQNFVVVFVSVFVLDIFAESRRVPGGCSNTARAMQSFATERVSMVASYLFTTSSLLSFEFFENN